MNKTTIYDIKILDIISKRERETVRGLTYGQATALTMALKRMEVKFIIKEVRK